MTQARIGYWRRLWAALAGREPWTPHPGPADEQIAGLRAQVASLEMDLAERDRQIAQMRSEYGNLEVATQNAATGAGQEELARLFKRLSGTLANVAALTAAAEAGRRGEGGDLISLIHSLEKDFARAGLEAIGKVGQKTEFAVAWHQRMSGGAVHPGTPVTVQFPGYRMGTRMLMKAMVSASEDSPREDAGNG
jgi:molecular chaperone GrpE (heat shock protein)